MRASIVIAAHNEGDLLWKTVGSCFEASDGLDCEIVVADDASSDGSIAEVGARFRDIRVVASTERRGCSATKDLGARSARGDVIVFLDGHCKPEPGALGRLVSAVESWDGNAIVSPGIPDLDPDIWESNLSLAGKGYWLDLEWFRCGWANDGELREITGPDGRRYLEQPCVVGCCLAVSRSLYEKLRGFDPDMRSWGTEDLDFGLKSWLMGHSSLVDPDAFIGHRFRKENTPCSYEIPFHHDLHNRWRMARKNMGDDAWQDWVSRHGKLFEAPLLDRVWKLYDEGRDSLEAERDYLMRNRCRSEYDYAAEFGLIWPLTLPSSPFDASKIPAAPRFQGLVAGAPEEPGKEQGHTVVFTQGINPSPPPPGHPTRFTQAPTSHPPTQCSTGPRHPTHASQPYRPQTTKPPTEPQHTKAPTQGPRPTPTPPPSKP